MPLSREPGPATGGVPCAIEGRRRQPLRNEATNEPLSTRSTNWRIFPDDLARAPASSNVMARNRRRSLRGRSHRARKRSGAAPPASAAPTRVTAVPRVARIWVAHLRANFVIFLALDPGLSGAFAAIDDDGLLVALHDLPIIRDGKLAFVDAPELVSLMIEARDGRPARIYVERVGSMPGQGVASSFQFGVGFGSLLAACRFIAMPLDLVTPADGRQGGSMNGSRNPLATSICGLRRPIDTDRYRPKG